METFSALLALCAGNSPVTGEFPAQRPVTRSFDVFFDLRIIKRLSKYSQDWWFETLSRPLWRHCNGHMVSPGKKELTRKKPKNMTKPNNKCRVALRAKWLKMSPLKARVPNFFQLHYKLLMQEAGTMFTTFGDRTWKRNLQLFCTTKSVNAWLTFNTKPGNATSGNASISSANRIDGLAKDCGNSS